MKKKAMALVLVLCMALSMLPVTAFAAQPKPAPEAEAGVMSPRIVGELEPASVVPNAKSYSVSLTGSGNGEVELLVDSPAKAGSEVYFLANPDDGYLAEVYYEGLSDDALVYVGADVIGFIMPANKVKLEVKFVKAQGDSHRIRTVEYYSGTGQCALSRESAKQYESILLAVLPNNANKFDPERFVFTNSGILFYLFEDEGIHYYELIMGDTDADIGVVYYKPSASPIHMLSAPEGGTVTWTPEKAVFLDTVTVTIVPDPGYKLVRAVASSAAGSFNSTLTPIGNNKYTFTMHPEAVELYVTFEAILNDVTVKAGAGGKASANVSQAKVGDTVTVTCQPDDNYRVYSITGVQGIQDKGNNIYTFTMPEKAVTVNVSFRKIYNPVNLTVETGLGGSAITNVTEGKLGDIITLTCTPEEGYRVARITGVKDLTDNGDGTYTFTMPDEAVDIKVLFLRHENPFLDVNETQFFYDSVLWAVEEGITSGMTPTEFGPFSVCNRAQVVTFLWRAAGCPEPAATEHPFTDVAAGSFYEKPVLWAVENGITTGISATEFGPNLACNRAQVVTFLFRAWNAQAPEDVENPFEDVKESDFFYAPVLWALANGVTTGADATHFNPNGQCQRAQVVTFLYRADKLPVNYDIGLVLNDWMEDPSECGTVTLSHTKSPAGETVTAEIIPAEGWVLDRVWCENGTEVTQVSDTVFTFVMPDHDEVLHAELYHVEEPTEPEEPEEPIDPVDPEPTEPTDPTEPAEPEEPFE